jgi:multidrug resistance efflux pump
MEILLLGIYSFFVWLIFFKFKWLPWNIVSQVIVITLPIFALTALILILNIVAPSSHDVRVINYVVPVVPRVTGRVIEVPIEPNRPIKKGDVLFRIDPAPFQFEVDSLKSKLAVDEAKLEADKGKLAAERAELSSAEASLVTAEAGARELQESLAESAGRIATLRARLDLARKRLEQNRELAESGAGDRFALEQAETDVLEIQGELASAVAAEAQVNQRLSAQVNGELASIAGARSQLEMAKAQVLVAESQLSMSKAQIELTRAQLADAEWSLDQTVYYAPANGTVVSLALRPGAVASIMVTQPVMTFVEDEQWILAIYKQNEVRKIMPGQEAEIALKTYPGRIIKCKVDSVMWATAQGQLPIGSGGNIAGGGVAPIPANSLAVRLLVDEKEQDLFLAAGAHGMGAVYTDSGHMIHILRKVILRVGSKLDWLIPKLH